MLQGNTDAPIAAVVKRLKSHFLSARYEDPFTILVFPAGTEEEIVRERVANIMFDEYKWQPTEYDVWLSDDVILVDQFSNTRRYQP